MNLHSNFYFLYTAESQSRRVTRGVQQKTEELVPLFDTKKHTTEEIRQYKRHCLELVSQMLSSRDFDITVCWFF